MKSPKKPFRGDGMAWKQVIGSGPFLIGIFALSALNGCKNTPQGPVPIWNAPPNSTAPQSDPLFGPANNVQPPNQVAPTLGGPAPMVSTLGNNPAAPSASLGTPQPTGPLPPLAAPHTMSSPAALATGATGQLTNPRDPYTTQPITTPTLAAPIVNTSAPGSAATNPPGSTSPIQLRQPEIAPSNNWSAPPAGGFNSGNPPPPSPPPGTLNSNANFLQQSQSGLNSLQNNIANTAQQGQKDLTSLANSANATANQYKQGAVQTQQQLFNQGKQVQTDLTNSATSSMDRLKQQLAQQGQAVDGVMQSTLTSLDESLRRQGMVWQNVQKQADGTWKSIASFADPNNPSNRTTREVVAATPEAAMRALLGDASGAPKPPPTGMTPPFPGR